MRITVFRLRRIQSALSGLVPGMAKKNRVWPLIWISMAAAARRFSAASFKFEPMVHARSASKYLNCRRFSCRAIFSRSRSTVMKFPARKYYKRIPDFDCDRLGMILMLNKYNRFLLLLSLGGQ